MNKALDRPEGGVNIGAEKIPSFLGLKSLKPFISKELTARIFKPIVYIPHIKNHHPKAMIVRQRWVTHLNPPVPVLASGLCRRNQE